MSDADPFPVIYANWGDFFTKANTGYFGYNEKPEYIKTYMDALNKDIIARNNAKKQAALDEGRDPPKLGKGPTFGPDELEPENTTCAIQVSQGLNAAGVPVPGVSIQRPNYAIPGGNGFYLHNVSELTSFLTIKYGETPNLKGMSNDAESVIKGRKGILTFGNVHTEMYNGSSIVQSGKINEENGHTTAPMGWNATWGQPVIRFWEIRSPGEKGKPEEKGSFLNGWWSVYDGNTYFYYFALPYVVYTKTRPAPTAGAPYNPSNRGTVKAGPENTYIVTWNVLPGDSSPTIETFWLIWGKTREMNAKSNKYSMIYASKISPDKTG